MEIKLYKQENCDFCKQVVIPQELKVNVVDIRNGYTGFIPEQVPVLQVNGMNFSGPQSINQILNVIKASQDGYYKG